MYSLISSVGTPRSRLTPPTQATLLTCGLADVAIGSDIDHRSTARKGAPGSTPIAAAILGVQGAAKEGAHRRSRMGIVEAPRSRTGPVVPSLLPRLETVLGD